MSHQAVTEIEQSVKMMGSGNQEKEGNCKCGSNGPVGNKINRECNKTPYNITGERVEVGMSGKIFEILRFAERENCGKLEEGDEGHHTHSL